MASSSYEVHQTLKGEPLRLVLVRAVAFQALQNKRFIVQIRSEHGKSEYFEAAYADDNYMDRRKAKDSKLSGNNLIFMSELHRKLLNVKPLEMITLEKIQKDSLYIVHSALEEDSNEGRIWIKPSRNADLCKEIKDRRRIIRIRREAAKSFVYSEALFADDHYLENWKKKGIEFEDDNLIFISAWYRRLLNIGNTPVIIDGLNIKPLHRQNLYALLYRYPRDHPQALILMSSMLGIIGFGLGVIVPGVRYVRSLWTPMIVPDLDTAKITLAKREGIKAEDIPRYIGYVSPTGEHNGQSAETIGRWALYIGLDAVVWTNLPPKLQNEVRVPSVAEVISFLQTRPPEIKKRAEEYVRKTPPQIDTEYRRRIEVELNWTPMLESKPFSP